MTEREIIKPELPKGWTNTTLGEVLERLSNGITQKQGDRGLPVTRIETISKGIIDLERVGYLEGLSPDTIEKFTLIYGDILFSHINSDAHLGKTAIFKLLETRLLHGMNLLLVRVNQDVINPDYLNYLMKDYKFLGIFYNIAQHAVNQSSINQAKLKALQIPLPPLPEQHRIVDKIEELFTRLDAGVEALKKIQLQLKRYRQSVLKSAFSGELTAEWRESRKGELEPASVLLEKVKQERKRSYKYKELPPRDTTDLPELPEGWVWVTILDIAEKNRNAIKAGPFGSSLKKEFYTSTGYKIYGQEQVLCGDSSYGDYYIDSERFEKLKSCAVKSGDVLISLVGTIGKVLVLPETIEPGIINPRLVKLSLDRNLIRNTYFKTYVESYAARQFFSLSSHGGTMDILNLSILKTLPIPLPSINEQHKIVEEIERHFSIADEIESTMQQSLKQADRLRQSILKKAFEGKLVNHNPNDEPAEKLLERIKAERAKNEQGAVIDG